MKTRIIIVLILVLIMLSGGGARVYYLIRTDGYRKAALVRSTTTLVLGSGRGIIYDTNGEWLVEDESYLVAAVSPNEKTIQTLSNLMPDQAGRLLQQAKGGKPFLFEIREPLSIEGVSILEVTKRYSLHGAGYSLSHIVGYTDGSGKGVTGIELAYDHLLSDARKRTISYTNDAYGKLISGLEPEIRDLSSSSLGVQLTIDKRVQQIAADAAKDKGLTSGAVVVLSIPDNEILASVSLPGFNPDNVAASLKEKGSPLLNKVFCAYSTGSVFKLVVAAAALDAGVPPGFTVDCKGNVTVGNVVFHCHHLEGHGKLDMCGGISQSCNIYFIELAKKIGGQKIREYAQRLGFGSSELLASSISAQSGTLPSSSTLRLPAGLANFSFGQGELTATPLQIGMMVSCIAGGGQLYAPSLVKGTVDDAGILQAQEKKQPVRVIEESTAEAISGYMRQTMLTGTGRNAMPKEGGAGGKTATAETGILIEGREINRAWFAGFYPAQNPRYSIVVMSEDGISGSESAGPVFQAVCDGLAKLKQKDTELP